MFEIYNIVKNILLNDNLHANAVEFELSVQLNLLNDNAEETEVVALVTNVSIDYIILDKTSFFIFLCVSVFVCDVDIHFFNVCQ